MTQALIEQVREAVAREDWATVGAQLPQVAECIAELERAGAWPELRELAKSLDKLRQVACVQRAHCFARLQVFAAPRQYTGLEAPTHTFSCDG